MAKKCSSFALLLIFLLNVASALAQQELAPVRLFAEGQYPLNLHMQVLEDKTNNLTIDDVTSDSLQAQFITNKSPLPNFGVSKSTYWLKVKLLYSSAYPNKEHQKQWLLEVGKCLLNVAELYIPEANGIYVVKSSDLREDWDQREVLHVNSVFPLTTYLDEEVTLYLKLKNHSSLQTPLTLWSREAFTKKVAKEEFIYGVFFGGMIIMLIYNIFVYVSVRDPGYLYYVLYLGWVTFFEMLEVGHGAIHAGKIFESFGKEYIPLTVLLSLGAAVLFSREFLRTKQRNPRIDVAFKIIFFVILFSCFLSFIIDYQEGILWVTSISMSVLTCLLLVSLYSWIKGNADARYFFFAWLFNCIGFIVFSLMINQVIPTTTLTVMSAPLGVFFEAIILSFALANRIKRTQKEALDADKEAMEHLSKFRSIFDNSQVGMYQMTLFGVVTDANKYFAKMLGFSNVSELFKNGKEVKSKLYNLSQPQFETFLKNRELMNELEFTNIKGDKLWVNHQSQAIYGNDGKLDHIEGILINNTENIEKEIAIRSELKERINKELATKSTEQKSKFLSMMSHNIRTPLTSIIGYSELLQEDDFEEKERAVYIDSIVDSSRLLLRLINNILDFSKIEAGKFDLEAIPTNLIDVIEKLKEEYIEKAKLKGIKFHLEQNFPYPESILGDPTRIYQILSNLCENAIKATNKGEVKTSISWKDEALIFSVSDTGIGMPPAMVESLFAHEQGAADGLGLIISKRLSNLLGGDITCHSQVEKGSTFDFVIKPTLPENVLWIDKKRVIKKDNSREIPILEGTVLLAEDNVVNQRIIEKVLKKTGVDVIVVNDGLEACEYCDSNNPDFILMDINMPNRDGLEATKYLRDRLYTMPIFALTAETDKQKIDEALSAGCEGALSKPLDKQALYKTLAEYLPAGKRKLSHSSPQR